LEGGIHKGSQIVNDIIAAVSPEFLFCGHVSAAYGREKINQTTVVNPGALADGRFAIVDTQKHEVNLMQI
jgi:Icc-related predicted phosphoesterase